jgi:hypothetical protein
MRTLLLGQETVGLNRHRLPFDFNRRLRFEVEKAFRLLIGGLANQGFARFGQDTEPGGDVDGISGNVVRWCFFEVKLPGYRKAGIDANVHGQGLTYALLDLFVNPLHRLMNFTGGFDRPHRIVFVSAGHAK